MKVCPRCKTQLPDDLKNCPNCGSTLLIVADRQENNYASKPPQNGWASAMKIILGIIFAAIIIVGVIAGATIGLEESPALGIAIFFGSIIGAIFLLGFSFVFLYIADDIREIKNNTYQIGRMIEDKINSEIRINR